MAFITATAGTAFGETITSFAPDTAWEAVIVNRAGDEKVLPLVGWAVLEQRRGDSPTQTVIVGAWAAANSGYLETVADWEDVQAREKPEQRWTFKQYRPARRDR